MPVEVESKPGPVDEADLLRRLHESRDGAFDELVELYKRDVYRTALRLTGSAAEADDVAQETFVRAWQALPRFRGEASLRTWLLRIAAHLSLNVVESARVARRAAGKPEDLAVEAGAEEVMIREEWKARLGPAISALPDRQRTTLLLRVDQGLMFKEIASVMGCTTGTAKANFFHAVAALKRALGGLG